MSEQNVFNNIDDLIDSLEEDKREESSKQEEVSINNTSTDAPVLTPTVAPKVHTDTPKEEKDTSVTVVPEAPALEAQLLSDRKNDMESGKTEEVFNATLDAMRKLALSSNKISGEMDKISELLANVEIDPYKAIINKTDDSSPLALHDILEQNSVFTPKYTFPVIALKSGYKAEISALTTNEKIEIRNINGSALDQTLKLLKLIHRKIVNTSVGRISFDKFLQITAESDYETLVYGLYAASFPNATEYTLECPHCGEKITLPLYPSQLIEVIDRERSGKYVQEVLLNYNKGEEFLKSSLVQQRKRIVLPHSKSIVEIITPTLHQMISNMRITENLKNRFDSELIAISKSISNIAVLDIGALQAGQGVKYVGLPTGVDTLSYLSENVNGEDMKAIRRAISEQMRTYSVKYRIPDFTCPAHSCSKEIKEVEIDLVNLLFFGIIGEM